MFFLWIRRNQNSPRIWPNLGQLKPCQEFHNFPNLLFQESCLLTNRPRKLVSTNFLPSSISSPLSHLLSGTCNLTIPLSLSLSLSLLLVLPSPSSVPNSACLLVHFMNFLLTNDTRKPNTRSYLSYSILGIVCKNVKNLLPCLDTSWE